MLDHPLPDIDSWTLLFNSNSLPVLRVTKRRLDEMRADLDRVDVRELARLILQDPIMTVRVLAFIQPMRGRSLQRDITTIASAVMMAGIEPFFNRFTELFTIEDQLKEGGPQALLGVLQIVRRAQRAADLGMNSIRLFLHHLLPEVPGFWQRLDDVLGLADAHGIGAMLVLFDGCWKIGRASCRERVSSPV